jgi:hypothetical protein
MPEKSHPIQQMPNNPDLNQQMPNKSNPNQLMSKKRKAKTRRQIDRVRKFGS